MRDVCGAQLVGPPEISLSLNALWLLHVLGKEIVVYQEALAPFLQNPCHFYEESRGLVRSGQLSYSLLLLSILLYLVIVWLWVFYRFTSLVPFPPLVFDLLAVREQRGFVHHISGAQHGGKSHSYWIDEGRQEKEPGLHHSFALGHFYDSGQPLLGRFG